MVQLVDQKNLNALTEQLLLLTKRCQQWDNKITLTDNKSFRFEVHLFTYNSLTLFGYSEQIQATLTHLKYVINNM